MHRILLRSVGAAAVGLTLIVAIPGRAATRGSFSRGDAFVVPAAAFVRPLGAIASSACAVSPYQECQGNSVPKQFGDGFPMSVPGLGVPVGGVGAGAFMVNQSGTFGPWNFGGSQDNSWEMRS